jgi:hypothetical protein
MPMRDGIFVHPTSEVSPEARVGKGTKLWQVIAVLLGGAVSISVFFVPSSGFFQYVSYGVLGPLDSLAVLFGLFLMSIGLLPLVSGKQSLIPLVFISAAALVIFNFEHRGIGIFVSEQNTYFAAGLRLAGSESLEHDWFANKWQIHFVFSYLVALMSKLHVLRLGMFLIELGLAVTFAYSLWLVARIVARTVNVRVVSLITRSGEQGREGRDLAVAAVGYALAVGWMSWYGVQGLAGQTIYVGYLAPAEFGILVVAALAALEGRRWFVASLLLTVVYLFHSSFVIHTSTIVVVAMVFILVGLRRRKQLWPFWLFFVALAPYVFYISWSVISAPGDITQSSSILALIRLPHHASPPAWWDMDSTKQVVAMLAASVVLLIASWKSLLSWQLAVGTIFVIVGTGIVAYGGSNQLALLFPWRASIYLYPISIVTLMIVLAAALLAVPRATIPDRLKPYAGLSSLGILCALMLFFPIWRLLPQENSTFQLVFNAQPVDEYIYSGYRRIPDKVMRTLYHEVHAQTSVSDRILVPPEMQDFRLAAERAVVVDGKSHPLLPSDVLEWDRRLRVVEAFYDGHLSTREAAAVCQEFDADYYISLTGQGPQFGRAVAAVEDLVLRECRL